jgi:surface antigen
LAAAIFVSPAIAASLDEQIQALTAQANAQQAQAAQYRAQADTLANKLASINAQADAIAAQISANQAKQQKLAHDIEDAKQQLIIKKQILDENIRQIYQQSQISPLEMLASSKNFSEYVDRQQYLDQIKDHIQEAAAAIQKLKADLEKQQVDVQNLIRQQSDLQQSLAIQQAEARQLLADTQGQESAYSQMAAANNAKASQLKAQQAAILASTFGGHVSGGGACGGGYPGKWCNAEQDTIIDNWGMYNRECVSYAAFRVAASNRYMPYWGGRGNANEWVNNAQGAGIPVDHSPRAGDVAISLAGPYGHAMYVESVSGGSVYVSQYNYGNNGEYSTMTIPASGLYFIHF